MLRCLNCRRCCAVSARSGCECLEVPKLFRTVSPPVSMGFARCPHIVRVNIMSAKTEYLNRLDEIQSVILRSEYSSDAVVRESAAIFKGLMYRTNALLYEDGVDENATVFALTVAAFDSTNEVIALRNRSNWFQKKIQDLRQSLKSVHHPDPRCAFPESGEQS